MWLRRGLHLVMLAKGCGPWEWSGSSLCTHDYSGAMSLALQGMLKWAFHLLLSLIFEILTVCKSELIPSIPSWLVFPNKIPGPNGANSDSPPCLFFADKLLSLCFQNLPNPIFAHAESWMLICGFVGLYEDCDVIFWRVSFGYHSFDNYMVALCLGPEAWYFTSYSQG